MNIKLGHGNSQIKSIKFYNNGNIKKEKYYDDTIIRYDENNNEIHYKNSDGYEYWNEYDNKGNVIHHKDSNGYEYWYEYDENNNIIHYKNSNGYLRYCRTSNGDEYWWVHDNDGNIFHMNSRNKKVRNMYKDISEKMKYFYTSSIPNITTDPISKKKTKVKRITMGNDGYF